MAWQSGGVFGDLRYKYIKAKGEFHMNNPEMSRALHQAVRNNEPLQYEERREKRCGSIRSTWKAKIPRS